MSTLKVSRLDSPLARSAVNELAAQREPPPADPPPPASAARQRRRASAAGTVPKEPAAQLAAKASPGAAMRPAAATDELAEPPALDETLELLSARVPASLRRNVAEMTVALRARQGGRVSQKRLPEQELVAVALWMIGSAQDPADVDAFARAHDAYRARQHTAAAAALTARP